MANVTNSGYLASAVTVSFTGTQTLDSLADNEWTNLSDAIDNGTNKYLRADFELVLGSAAFSGADSDLVLYFVLSVDGTNYADYSGNATTEYQGQEPYSVGAFVTSGTTAAQRLVLRDIPLPQGLFKIGVRNRSGIALAASGNTLKYRPHSIAI